MARISHLEFFNMSIINLNLCRGQAFLPQNFIRYILSFAAGMVALGGGAALAQNQTVNGSLDVIAGPITLGTAQIWDSNGSWDPYNPVLTGADGLTIQFQDTGAWETGTPAVDVWATFQDPDGFMYTGDESWSWYDNLNNFQSYQGVVLNYNGNSVDGYSQTSATIHYDAIPDTYNLGMATIDFVSAKPATQFRWQISHPDGSGGFNQEDLMTLTTDYGLYVNGSISSNAIQANALTVSGAIYGYSGTNVLYSQTLGGGNGSIMTLGLSDARYLRRDTSVTVTGSYAGGVGQNLIAAGTQFVSGKNNVSDSSALFIVGAGSSNSTRKNALTVSSAGNTALNGTLTVTGATTLSSTLAVSGVATLSSTLSVAGASTLQALNATTGSFSGNVTVGGTLTVGGQAVLTQTAADSLYLTSSNASATYVSKAANSVAIGDSATAAGGALAVGAYSIAGAGAISLGTWAGSNGTPASGDYSISMGYASHGYGEKSISMGHYNWASANDSVSIGSYGNTLSQKSVAIGHSLYAYRLGQVVLGAFNATPANVASAYSNTAQATDEIFVVGNGSDENNRSNAFTIMRNGNAEVVGGLAVAGAITSNGHAVLTAEDAASFVLQSALDDTVEELPTLYLQNSSDSFAIGTDALAGEGGFAIGSGAVAGANALSFGTGAGNDTTPASGASSVSIGHESRGAGAQSIALGKLSWAGGANAIAAGHETEAHSDNTVAIGRSVVANRWGQVVLGTFNVPAAITSNSPQSEDDIFVVGNGTSSSAKANALVIKRNGFTQVTGPLSVGGDTIFDEEVTAAKAATFKAGVMVEGTRDAGNPAKVTASPGGEILVPEQGDISMGDFRAGPQPAQP